MKRLFALSALCLMTLAPALWAIPSEINYQGTLRQDGVPVNVPTDLTFQLTSQDGNTPYSNGITMKAVPVINGLFSTKLDFTLLTGLTWETITPYIKVTVGTQTLSPTEKVSATVYADVSNSVVDGAITPTKVAGGYGLVPSGMIAIFSNSCPSGWTIFTGLQGRFPVGADPTNLLQFTVGESSGTLTHSHTFTTSIAGAHNHGGKTGGPSGLVQISAGNNAALPTDSHTHTISSDGAHQHTGITDLASNLPPYLTMVFCAKQ